MDVSIEQVYNVLQICHGMSAKGALFVYVMLKEHVWLDL